MIPEWQMKQFGNEGMEVRGITIHNTGNNLSARENAKLMKNSTHKQDAITSLTRKKRYR